MNTETIQYVTQMYDRYAARMEKDGWRITLREWVDFWSEQPILEAKMKSPKGVVIFRLVETDPWTIDNLAVVKRGDRIPLKNVRQQSARTSKKRVLTVEQWLMEIRH